MNTDEKLLTLLQRVRAKTEAGTLTWEVTTTRGQYQAAFSRNVLKIDSRDNVDESRDYVITILDESGRVLESFDDTQLNARLPSCGAFAIMGDIFTMARRQALGVDEALDSMLEEL